MTSILRNIRRLTSIQSLVARNLRTMSTIREVKIPVPWGHIAGRESGPVDGKPLLMLHGWLDNCGTFDGIQQHLPQTYRCINIDVPGHGLSSHLPPGIVYSMFDGVYYIRLIREHFGWQRFSLLGHSMGSGMCVLYSAAFPEEIETLTILDLVKFVTRPVEQHPDITRDSALSYMETMRKLATRSQPEYTYEELRRRLVNGTGLKGHEDAADALLVRGSRRNPETGLYQYTYDLRRRVRTLQPADLSMYLAYARRLRCRLLLVLATEGGDWIGSEEEAQAIAAYREGCSEVRLERPAGGHHVHLTHPERMLPIINDFLLGSGEQAAATAAAAETAATGRSSL